MLLLDNYSINRTHGRFTLKRYKMNLYIDMIDTTTGALIARKTANYVMNFAVKNDSGFAMIQRWCESAVRGVRMTEHKDITLNIRFNEEKESMPLFGNKDFY